MADESQATENDWIALMIGNSRLHWGWFQGKILQFSLDTPHLCNPLSIEHLLQILSIRLTENLKCVLPLKIASVVPSQTQLCLSYADVQLITLNNIPLKNLYPTLGIDRALGVLGGRKYGFPCLVIDAGTALTFTGVDGERRLVGGAILAGLSVQFQSLVDRTATLPRLSLPDTLPPFWGRNTTEAIESGILQTILAGIEKFIREWLTLYPNSSILLTGGDALILEKYLRLTATDSSDIIQRDPNLIFQGILEVTSFSGG